MRPCPFDVGGAAVVITVDRPEAVNVPDPLRLPTFAMFATLPVFEIVALVLLMEYAPPAAGIVPAESPGVVEVYTGVVWPKSCWGGGNDQPGEHAGHDCRRGAVSESASYASHLARGYSVGARKVNRHRNYFSLP